MKILVEDFHKLYKSNRYLNSYFLSLLFTSIPDLILIFTDILHIDQTYTPRGRKIRIFLCKIYSKNTRCSLNLGKKNEMSCPFKVSNGLIKSALILGDFISIYIRQYIAILSSLIHNYITTFIYLFFIYLLAHWDNY